MSKWQSATEFLDDREDRRTNHQYAHLTLTRFGRLGRSLEDLVIDHVDAQARRREPASTSRNAASTPTRNGHAPWQAGTPAGGKTGHGVHVHDR